MENNLAKSSGSGCSSSGLPLSVRMLCFDTPGLTFETFLGELERASTDPDDIHIFNFSVQIAHAVPGIGGGHFSLLADYDRQTQEIVVTDTNPKKYTRYWKCPAMDRDSSSTRPRGMLVLRRGPVATAAAVKQPIAAAPAAATAASAAAVAAAAAPR